MNKDVLTGVCTILREVAAEHVLPRFGALGRGDVQEKSAGELVTVADREAEAALAAALARVEPAALFIGEEACAGDPALRGRIGEGLVWLVDPIDGTANFAAGRPPFAIMVALLRDGVTQASWLFDPLLNQMSCAKRACGAWQNGRLLSTSDELPDDTSLRGIVSNAFVPPEYAAIPGKLASAVGNVLATQRCAGHEYPLIASGACDFALYWRTLPWDHVPGVLLVEAAGGTAVNLDGERFDPQTERKGLLAARNNAIAQRLLKIINQ